MARWSKLPVFLTFLGLLLFDGAISARVLQKSLNISVIEEVIDNKTFIHRVDILNGKRDERWAIDGQSVQEDEYDEAILEAEKAERRQERKACKKEQRDHDEFVIAFQRAGCAKIIELYLVRIKDELYRLADRRLKQFLHFEEDTISSEKEFDYIKNVLIIRAQELLDTIDEVELEELQGMMRRLEEYPKNLRALYYGTVKNAQAHSDDTKLLKDLLSIISEPQ